MNLKELLEYPAPKIAAPRPGEVWKKRVNFGNANQILHNFTWGGSDHNRLIVASAGHHSKKCKVYGGQKELELNRGIGSIFGFGGQKVFYTCLASQFLPNGLLFENNDYFAAAGVHGQKIILSIWKNHDLYYDGKTEPWKEFIAKVNLPQPAAYSLAWNPTKHNLIAILIDENIHKEYNPQIIVQLWDIDRGEMLWERSAIVSHGILWSSDGSSLAIPAPYGHGFCMFDLNGKTIDCSSFKSSRNSIDNRYAGCISWHPSGRYFATETDSGTIGLFEIQSRNCLHHIPADNFDKISAMQWSPDGLYLAICGRLKGQLGTYIVDVANAQFTHEFLGAGFNASNYSWSPEGVRLIIAYPDGELNIVDPKGGQKLYQFKLDGPSELDEPFVLNGPIYMWNPYGYRIAFGKQGIVSVMELQY